MASNSHYPGLMSAAEFAKAAKQADVSPTKLDRARRVLVDGKTIAVLGTYFVQLRHREGLGSADPSRER